MKFSGGMRDGENFNGIVYTTKFNRLLFYIYVKNKCFISGNVISATVSHSGLMYELRLLPRNRKVSGSILIECRLLLTFVREIIRIKKLGL